MHTDFTIQQAITGDAPEIAVMVGELLGEIMAAIGTPAFHFSLAETTSRLTDFIHQEKYVVFIARDPGANPAGFIALSESHALYAGGAFGIIPELYVRPEWRSRQLGLRLVSRAKAFGASRGWTRLEVTTPPLPEFDKTRVFYEREGFSVSGGRKLKIAL